MKIAIDGFNLGLAQGTGIATYGRELASVLEKSGNEVFPIYGLDIAKRDEQLFYSQFIQRLGVSGESDKRSLINWAGRFLSGFPSHILGRPFNVDRVATNRQIALGSVRDKLPVCTEILNSSSIFKVSQAYSVLTKQPTKLSLPVEVDLLHLTLPLPLSISKVPKAVTVHDIIPLILPSSTKVNIPRYTSMLRTALRDADVIFSVSECSKRDVVQFLNIPEQRIHVTYQSVDIPEQLKNITQDECVQFLKNNYDLKFAEYFLYYGAIEPKKNVAKIIEAFSQAKTDCPIVIVGKDGWLFDDVQRLLQSAHMNSKGRKRFIRIPYLPFQQLMFLLRGARGLVFPSLYEGFGLPVLEAMQMGCPVITSHVSSLPEVGGEAVHYVDPYDTESIVSAVEKFSSDNEYRADLIKKGYVQAQKFSKSNYLKLLNHGYEKALSR